MVQRQVSALRVKKTGFDDTVPKLRIKGTENTFLEMWTRKLGHRKQKPDNFAIVIDGLSVFIQKIFLKELLPPKEIDFRGQEYGPKICGLIIRAQSSGSI